MKTRVYIATSEGPSEVQSLIEEDADIACAVCLNGSIKALPITRDYNAFVRKPTGVIEKMTGHKSYRVDVSHPITNGESWQLGLYLAHALALKNELALEGEAAERVLLVTGAVSARDELVQSVSHIQQKLNLAKDKLQGLGSEVKVSFVLPTADRDQIENDHGIHILPVGIASEALQRNVRNADSNKATKKMVLWAVAATFLVAVVALGQNNGFLNGMLDVNSSMVEGATPDVQKSNDPSVEVSKEASENVDAIEVSSTENAPISPAKTDVDDEPYGDQPLNNKLLENVVLRIRKLSPADGQSCAGRKFRGSKLQASKIKAPWKVGLIDDPSICGLRLAIKNKNTEAIQVNLKVFAEQGDLLRRRDPAISLKVIEIPAGLDYKQDVNFSLYRSGNYQLNLSYGITNGETADRKLRLIPVGKIENTEIKYQ